MWHAACACVLTVVRCPEMEVVMGTEVVTTRPEWLLLSLWVGVSVGLVSVVSVEVVVEVEVEVDVGIEEVGEADRELEVETADELVVVSDVAVAVSDVVVVVSDVAIVVSDVAGVVSDVADVVSDAAAADESVGMAEFVSDNVEEGVAVAVASSLSEEIVDVDLLSKAEGHTEGEKYVR